MGRPSYAGTSMGWFVRRGQEVYLLVRGMRYPLDRCSILQGSFGFDTEGTSKLPRPRVIDSAGNVLSEGDMVVALFPDANPNQVIVMGGARSVTPNDFIPSTYDAQGGGYNRLAVRVAPQDDNGKELGSVELEVAADDKGSVGLELSDDLSVRVKGGTTIATDGDTALSSDGKLTITVGQGAGALTITVQGGVATVGGASAQPVPLGNAFFGQLSAALTEIAAGLALIPSTNTVTTTLAGTLQGSSLLTTAFKAE